MHKLMEYICNELDELERKADKEGKLTAAEIEYADKLTHIKKNILRSEELWEDSEYSEDDGTSYVRGRNQNNMGGSSRYYGGSSRYDGGSMARGRGRNARRDTMGRYSRNEGADMMVEQLKEIMEDAPDDRTRQEFQRFIQKIEQM
jgi:hypothetical protein